ncbi:hypothetical protein BKA83DRAFT_4288351 [Pisolithus microcarpus]|nr:hypothetical protein BKA83DRAFT_4288351 [Pisolithus microcarpus]
MHASLPPRRLPFFSFLLHVPAPFGYLNSKLRVRFLSALWYLFFSSLFQPIISALHASGFKKTRVGASARERAMATQYTSDDNSLVSDEQSFVPSRQTVVPGSIPPNIIARNLDGAVNVIHTVDMSRQKLSMVVDLASVIHRKPSFTPSSVSTKG